MIRSATPDDAQALARLHANAWQQAHAGVLPSSLLDALDTNEGAENWRRLLADPAHAATVRLDETSNGELAGFASFGPSQDADASSGCGEILALYYSPPYWGSGRPGALWAELRTELMQAGYTYVTAWVLFENTRAIAFYRKQGFVFDGHERRSSVRGTELREIRMVMEPG